jgi:hypothetical protein
MTTVSQLIHMALRDANVIDESEAASGNMIANALDGFHQLLASWQVENIKVFAQQDTSFTPTGATSYAVGTGSTVNVARPAKIDLVYWSSGGIDYPVTLLDTFEQWESIPEKSQAGEPLYAFYLPTATTGTLYLYPQPSTGTVHVVTKIALPSTAALADTLTLPAEYLLPLRLNLYLLYAGTYGAPIKSSLAAMAASSLAALKRSNLRIEPLPVPVAAQGRGSILAGF